MHVLKPINFICVECAKVLKSEIMKSDIVWLDDKCSIWNEQKKVAEPQYFGLGTYQSQTFIDYCFAEKKRKENQGLEG